MAICWSVGYQPTWLSKSIVRFVDAYEVFCQGISASRSLTSLENLLAGLLVDFKDLINTQKSKHIMHSIV